MNVQDKDFKSLNGKMIDVKTADGTCDSYVTFPAGKKNLPAVILYMDAIGLRNRIFQMADKLASKGYYVLAPNIFYRSKKAPVVDYNTLLKPERMSELFSQVMAFASQLNPQLAERDAGSFISFLDVQPEINQAKLGAVGYCMGGGQAIRTAGNFPDRILAAASFHAGNVATDAETSPHLWFNKIKGEVFIGHADKDKSMPPEQIERVSEEIKKSKVNAKAELFKGCLHGWTMSDLQVYNEDGEEKHWNVIFDLFARNLN